MSVLLVAAVFAWPAAAQVQSADCRYLWDKVAQGERARPSNTRIEPQANLTEEQRRKVNTAMDGLARQAEERVTRARAMAEKCEERAAEKRKQQEETDRIQEVEREKRRLTAQEEAEKQAAIERADAAKLDEIARRPGFKADALSAELCVSREMRAFTAKEIATQHRYGRMTGAVRPADLYQLGQRIRALDEQIATMLGNMRILKLKPQSCSKPSVRRFAQCITDVYIGEQEQPAERVSPDGADCAADDVRAALRVMNPAEE